MRALARVSSLNSSLILRQLAIEGSQPVQAYLSDNHPRPGHRWLPGPACRSCCLLRAPLSHERDHETVRRTQITGLLSCVSHLGSIKRNRLCVRRGGMSGKCRWAREASRGCWATLAGVQVADGAPPARPGCGSIPRARPATRCYPPTSHNDQASCWCPACLCACRRLEGKVAVVTASTAGIGLGIVRRLASEVRRQQVAALAP